MVAMPLHIHLPPYSGNLCLHCERKSGAEWMHRIYSIQLNGEYCEGCVKLSRDQREHGRGNTQPAGLTIKMGNVTAMALRRR